MSDLASALVAIQRANKWTDEQMAEFLGCGRPLWNGIKLGNLTLSKRLLGRVSQEIQVLRPAVLAYLAEDTEAQAA